MHRAELHAEFRFKYRGFFTMKMAVYARPAVVLRRMVGTIELCKTKKEKVHILMQAYRLMAERMWSIRNLSKRDYEICYKGIVNNAPRLIQQGMDEDLMLYYISRIPRRQYFQ